MVRTSTVTTPKERNVSHSLSPDTQDKTLSSTCRMVKASAPTTAGRSLPHMETLPVCMDCGLSLCCCDGCSVEACEDQACEDQACSECDSSTECTEVCSSILPCCSGCVTPEICRRASKAVTKSQEFQDLNTFAFQMPDLSLNTSTDVLIGRRNASPVNFANMSDDSLFCHFGNECDLRFTSPVDMLQHIKSEHMPKMTSTCSPHFSMYPPIPQQDHHSNYPNVHPSMLHCEWDSCKASANTAHELFNHVESQHLQAAYQIPESHKCEWLIPGLSGQTRPCGVCLPSTEELTQHITQVHVGYKKNKYKCLWQGCERGERDFGQRQKVLRHMQTHTTHKPFQCNICSKGFAEESVLRQHMRIHSGERPFLCEECGKAFAAKSTLALHLRVHAGYKPLHCKFCGKAFSESSNLAKHVKIHTHERPHRFAKLRTLLNNIAALSRDVIRPFSERTN